MKSTCAVLGSYSESLKPLILTVFCTLIKQINFNKMKFVSVQYRFFCTPSTVIDCRVWLPFPRVLIDGVVPIDGAASRVKLQSV